MRSCETQLLITLQDLLSLRDRKVQVDVAILDFSKAFDTLPHSRPLGKLEYYGIDGVIPKWVSAFLNNRQQRVVVNGSYSNPVSEDCGVRQGTVLGPLLFLLPISDLPQMVSSQTRLFADDCLLYRPLRSRNYHVLLQRDLDTLQEWARFNPSISRSAEPITHFYSLGGEGPFSPILKPKSLEFFPPSHLTVFYLHSMWLGSQVTWRNPKWTRLLTWGYLGSL